MKLNSALLVLISLSGAVLVPSLAAAQATSTGSGQAYPAKPVRVFEPFHRLEASRSRDTGGTGLGLSIARNIARAHGGDIVLRNMPQGGLEAVLTLPHGG